MQQQPYMQQQQYGNMGQYPPTQGDQYPYQQGQPQQVVIVKNSEPKERT